MKSILCLIAAFASTAAFAGGAARGGSAEQGSAQGQPFANINETIAAMREALEAQVASLNAATQTQVDCLNDYLNGTASAADPSQCPDFSGSRIEDLNDELEELQLQLTSVADQLESASCAEGYTLATVDPVTCVAQGPEQNASANAPMNTAQVMGPVVTVRFSEAGSSSAECPVGYHATGCSFVATHLINVYSAYRTNPQTCTTTAYGWPGKGKMRAVAICASIE